MTMYAVDSVAARRSRVAGVVRRDFYALHRNPPRLVEMVFWPTLELVVWGFVSLYLQANAVHIAVAMLLGGVLLWHVVGRAQGELSVAFLEDVWSRNLLNVFVTPLSTGEYLAGLVVFGALKVTASVATIAGLAMLLYGFGVLTIGPALLPFLAVLMVMGWALGVLSIAAVLRFGPSAQTVAWILSAAFQPFAAVFYPVAILPAAAQAVAHAVPASHVFEGMRRVLAGGGIDWRSLGVAAALDALFVAVALVAMAAALRHARHRGRLSRFGE
jgi:ABC-2 type transport system permease protein